MQTPEKGYSDINLPSAQMGEGMENVPKSGFNCLAGRFALALAGQFFSKPANNIKKF